MNSTIMAITRSQLLSFQRIFLNFRRIRIKCIIYGYIYNTTAYKSHWLGRKGLVWSDKKHFSNSKSDEYCFICSMSNIFHIHLGSCIDYSLSRCSVYGLPVQCNNINNQLEKLENICQMSVERFGCKGTGVIKEYCRKTCSNCGMIFS